MSSSNTTTTTTYAPGQNCTLFTVESACNSASDCMWKCAGTYDSKCECVELSLSAALKSIGETVAIYVVSGLRFRFSSFWFSSTWNAPSKGKTAIILMCLLSLRRRRRQALRLAWTQISIITIMSMVSVQMSTNKCLNRHTLLTTVTLSISNKLLRDTTTTKTWRCIKFSEV